MMLEINKIARNKERNKIRINKVINDEEERENKKGGIKVKYLKK
jgi:hypothetical protein